MKKLSIIVPVYYNEQNLDDLYASLNEIIFKKLDMDYELIMVDDGSGDNSYELMKKIRNNDKRVKLVKLARNFGSHVALLAGLSHATGDCITCISADLQDPPENILEMLAKWKAGTKVVLAVRKDREESLFQKFFSNTYYRLMRRYALKDMPKGGFDSFLIDKKVASIICEMEEKNTSIMGQILWCGFKHEMIYYVRRKREKGKSRWTLSKKIKLFIDSFVSFSYVPIRFASIVGILAFVVSLVWIVVIVCTKLFVGIDTDGWTTLMAVLLLSSGLILSTLGIIGEYLWRIFDAVRNRPIYIIEETKGIKGEEK
ncbi:glycosyltransferase family 2 protein [Candidatus Saccharibacteria bacterium]|nr:glycosyltransferase family 2 protein [Candidatus Saccharibacteria bacterium]